ncbi:MAG TPA: endonuclease/exonuclease/phosphatase family protein, partial [Flavisolibacter sp.]
NYPVIVTGDFNAQPNDEPIQILTDSTNRDKLIDAKSVSQQPHYGPTGTFTGFKNKEIHDHPIDYIFIRNGVKVRQHATLSQTWQGRFSSDHFPVFAKVVIGNHKK